jgi:hypothetical protein
MPKRYPAEQPEHATGWFLIDWLTIRSVQAASALAAHLRGRREPVPERPTGERYTN